MPTPFQWAQLNNSLPPLIPAPEKAPPPVFAPVADNMGAAASGAAAQAASKTPSVFAPTVNSSPASSPAPKRPQVFQSLSPEELHREMDSVRHAPTGAPPVFASLSGMSSAPQLPAPARPSVFATPTPAEQNLTQNSARLQTMRTDDKRPWGFAGAPPSAENPNGLAPNHPGFLGKLGHVFARVGNIAGDVLAPSEMALIPGTQLNHDLNEAGLSRTVDREEGEIAENNEHGAQAANLDAQPELKQQAAELAQNKLDEKTQHDQAVLDQQRHLQLARNGQMEVTGADGQTHIVDDPDSQVYQTHHAVETLNQARQDEAEATAQLRQAQNDPNSPAYQLAYQRLQTARQNAAIAEGRLGLSAQEFSFNQDKFYNPQPTGTERSRGDLAQSALNQIGTMREIINSHPDMFGPGGAAKQAFQRWLSSDAEDAGKFLAASTFLAEHGAGALGARGEYIVRELQNLTNPNFDQSALTGTLDQAQQTFQHFANVGTTHGKGGRSTQNGVDGTPSGMVQVQIPGQHPGFIPSGSLSNFKKLHPNAQVVQ